MAKRPKLTTPNWLDKDKEAEGKEPTRETPKTEEKPASKKADAPKLKGQTVRLDEDTWSALAHLAIDQRRSQHELILEGIHLVLERYGRK